MEDSANESTAIRRRRYILHKLDGDGLFTYEDIEKKGAESLEREGSFPVSPQSVRDDIKYLQQLLRIQISKVRADDGRTVYLSGSDPKSSISAKVARAALNKEAKLAMAYVAAPLILGSISHSPNAFTIGSRERFPWKTNFEDPTNILTRLAGFPSLQLRLRNYWSAITRRICIDTGTSMDAICRRVIRHIQLPSPDTVLSYLEVCTNSRGVFSYLGRPEVNPRTIIIGGSQEVRTEAVCGWLAESFLEKFGLSFGIAFVGATVVDLKNRQFGSDHPRISTIKAKMLERASIKVVVADSSKFTMDPTRQYYPSVPLTSSAVDIVITDQDFNEFAGLGETDADNSQRDYFRSILRDSGIAFLSPLPATLGAAREKLAKEAKREKSLRAKAIGIPGSEPNREFDLDLDTDEDQVVDIKG